MQDQTYQKYYLKINVFFILKTKVHVYKTKKYIDQSE